MACHDWNALGHDIRDRKAVGPVRLDVSVQRSRRHGQGHARAWHLVSMGIHYRLVMRSLQRLRVATVAWAIAGFALGLLLGSWRLAGRPLQGPVPELADDWGGTQSIKSSSLPHIVAFVGIQTGFTASHAQPKYRYEDRRASLRATWVPADAASRKKLLETSGVVVEFVIGHSEDAAAETLIAKEEAQFGGFLRLDLVERYADLPRKTLMFFSVVLHRYNPDYIFKVDDDVYVRLDRVEMAVAQWGAIGADYVGCMKGGNVIKSPKYRWYEPKHALLGASYFTHAWGSAYVLSGSMARVLTAIPPHFLRRLANEDVTLGSWMLALNATHYDDRRMCAASCTNSSLVVYDYPQCAGLCDATSSLLALHASAACQTPATQPDGALPLEQPYFYFGEQIDEEWDAKAVALMKLRRLRKEGKDPMTSASLAKLARSINVKHKEDTAHL